MPEYDDILPANIAELEPKGFVTVCKQKVIPTEFERLEYIENFEEVAFPDLRSAFEWISKEPDFTYEFVFPIAGASLAGSLNYDPEMNQELLMLSSGKRTGISPKQIEGIYSVSTDNQNYFKIIFFPEDTFGKQFRERSVYISLPLKGTTPVLHFTFNPHAGGYVALAVAMTNVIVNARLVTDRLLDGYLGNPKP